MKYLLLSLFAGVFSLYVHGVDNLRLPDVRSVGMGGNVATQSILFNPALIVDKEKKSIHLEYFNRLNRAESRRQAREVISEDYVVSTKTT